MKELILKYAPVWLQNAAISVYNSRQYRLRQSGVYWQKRKYFEEAERLSGDDLAAEQARRSSEFLRWSATRSDWYRQVQPEADLTAYPVLEKADLLKHLDSIATIRESDAVVSLTGGTTGASMKVLYTKEDTQERHALLDHFRAQHGYTLGKKVAWFSGKSLVRKQDLARGICYRDDWNNKIRFFSTFHIADEYFDSYWKAFTEFAPEYIVGFPSSVYDLCMLARQRGLKLEGVVKAFFPTAETVLPMHREVIGEVFGCPLVDQYASSEGAPFILECNAGGKHIHPLSGIFEVVNEHMQPAREGEILVTSFTTHGTPLIRYRIGDRIRLAPPEYACPCGSAFPSVEYIDGRTSDFVLSRENGRVNLGNISNCTKDVAGIICFQVQQDSLQEVLVRVVADQEFDEEQEQRFTHALAERLGSYMKITVQRVDEILREKSGKFRIVKNNLDLSGGI